MNKEKILKVDVVLLLCEITFVSYCTRSRRLAVGYKRPTLIRIILAIYLSLPYITNTIFVGKLA